MIRQLRAADGYITPKVYKHPGLKLLFQLQPVSPRDHHGRNVDRAPRCAHRDRRPTLVVGHNNRPRPGLLGALDFIEKKTDAAIDQRDVTLDVIWVFQNFTCLRWIGVHQFTSNLANLLELPREAGLDRLVMPT